MKTNLAGKTRRRRREERERAGKPADHGAALVRVPIGLVTWAQGEPFVLEVVEHQCAALAAAGSDR